MYSPNGQKPNHTGSQLEKQKYPLVRMWIRGYFFVANRRVELRCPPYQRGIIDRYMSRHYGKT